MVAKQRILFVDADLLWGIRDVTGGIDTIGVALMEDKTVVCADDLCSIEGRADQPDASGGQRSISHSPRLFNRYLIWAVVVVGGVIGWINLSSRSSAAGYAALAAFAGFIVIRRVRLDRKFTAAGGVDSLVQGGRPVVLEFSSEFCGACLAVKPAAKQLASQLGGKARFVDLSVISGTGRSTAKELGITVTPTFVTFDAHGREVRRAHTPPQLQVVLALASDK
jgi:thiol-disulfide isomerase/thioredoxin